MKCSQIVVTIGRGVSRIGVGRNPSTCTTFPRTPSTTYVVAFVLASRQNSGHVSHLFYLFICVCVCLYSECDCATQYVIVSSPRSTKHNSIFYTSTVKRYMLVLAPPTRRLQLQCGTPVIPSVVLQYVTRRRKSYTLSLLCFVRFDRIDYYIALGGRGQAMSIFIIHTLPGNEKVRCYNAGDKKASFSNKKLLFLFKGTILESLVI